jgi:Golgi phosphoprotein 3 (GPP34)
MAQGTQEALTTAEELLLLAIDPRSGALHSHPTFRLPAALAGAVLLDLFADGSLALVDDTVLAGIGSDNSPYAVALERIRNLPTSHGVPWWVDAFGFAGKEAKAWTITSLAKKGVIAVETRLWLPPFPRTRYRLMESTARSAVANKILAALRADTLPDARSTALIVMAAECGFLNTLAPRSERRALSETVSALLQNQAAPSGNTLATGQRPTLIAQVYGAVYEQGFVGGAGN